MIDPVYKESVEAKVVEVFGERSLKHVYSMIEDVLEDEKMVCYISNFQLSNIAAATCTIVHRKIRVNQAR